MSERDERVKALAGVLVEHIAEAGGWHCSCQPVDETEGARDLLEGTWEAHVAETLLDSPAMRDLLAEDRAKALREAADDVSLVLANEVGGHTSTYSVRNWLRKRAIEEAGR